MSLRDDGTISKDRLEQDKMRVSNKEDRSGNPTSGANSNTSSGHPPNGYRVSSSPRQDHRRLSSVDQPRTESNPFTPLFDRWELLNPGQPTTMNPFAPVKEKWDLTHAPFLGGATPPDVSASGALEHREPTPPLLSPKSRRGEQLETRSYYARKSTASTGETRTTKSDEIMTIEDQPEETLYNTKKMSGYESETMEMGTEKSRRYHSAAFDTQGDNVSREVSERRIAREDEEFERLQSQEQNRITKRDNSPNLFWLEEESEKRREAAAEEAAQKRAVKEFSQERKQPRAEIEHQGKTEGKASLVNADTDVKVVSQDGAASLTKTLEVATTATTDKIRSLEDSTRSNILPVRKKAPADMASGEIVRTSLEAVGTSMPAPSKTSSSMRNDQRANLGTWSGQAQVLGLAKQKMHDGGNDEKNAMEAKAKTSATAIADGEREYSGVHVRGHTDEALAPKVNLFGKVGPHNQHDDGTETRNTKIQNSSQRERRQVVEGKPKRIASMEAAAKERRRKIAEENQHEKEEAYKAKLGALFKAEATERSKVVAKGAISLSDATNARNQNPDPMRATSKHNQGARPSNNPGIEPLPRTPLKQHDNSVIVKPLPAEILMTQRRSTETG
jgi:hypothetical protein